MARFNVVGLDDLQEQLLQREKIAEEAVPEMLKAGGAVMQEAQRAEIRTMFRSRRSTGDLAASIVVSKSRSGTAGRWLKYIRTGKTGTGYGTRQKASSCNTDERICQRARGSRRRIRRRRTL